MTSKPFTFDRVVRLLIGLTVLTLLFLLVQRLSNVLLPFLIAWLLAYLLQPVVGLFQYKLKLKSRVLAITCTLMIFSGAIGGLIWYLVPLVSNELAKLSQLVIAYTKDINVNSILPPAWQKEIIYYVSHLNIETLLKDENIMSGVKNLAPQLWDLINGSLDFVLGLAVVVVIFLYLIFILLDYEKI
ncbi:MAG: AI-2E family transporter, partial [Paludibacter sp.]